MTDEETYIATAAASIDDKLAARWALITMAADRKTEAEARAIAAQAVRDLTDNQKDRAA